MRKNECFFCTDCDAVKCPERLLQHLRRIAEQAGKEQYFNAVHLCGELVQDCMRELRVVLNRPRPGASACSPASPAPSDGASASSGGTGGGPSDTSSGPPKSTHTSSSTTSAPAAAVVADPSAAIRADPAKQYGRCPICGDWGANRERRINGNDQCPKGHSYPSSTAVYHVPPPQPEKVTPAAASAWDEFWAAHGVDDAKDREAMHYGDFNRFVAAREKAAVEAHDELRERCAKRAWDMVEASLAPKHDAGRAEGVSMEDRAFAADWPMYKMTPVPGSSYLSLSPAPKPRRAPEVVAEEIIAEWAGDQYARDRGYSRLTAIIAAAVRADRGEG